MFHTAIIEFPDFSESDTERHILSYSVNDSERVRPKGIEWSREANPAGKIS